MMIPKTEDFHGISLKLTLGIWILVYFFNTGNLILAQTDPTNATQEILDQLQEIIPYSLAYNEAVLHSAPSSTMQIDPKNSWKENLKIIQDNLQLDYRIIADQLILFPKKRFLIQGFIYDVHTGESLPGAHVVVNGNQIGTSSNEEGYFQLFVPQGIQIISVSYLGYQTLFFEKYFEEPMQKDFELDGTLDLPEIIVTENPEGNTGLATEENGTPLPLSILNEVPSIGAEMDITRYLQLSEGVITGGDGLGGIHVRGGNADQNLILLEDIPIYNPFHLFGTGSIFNSNAVQEARFSKSFVEPDQDGRLSSVLQVNIRDGHRSKKRLDASASLLGSHLLVETPILGNRGTLMLAGQRSHSGSIIRSYSNNIRSIDDNDGFFQPKFWDFYAKTLINLERKDKIIINAYGGTNKHLDINRYLFEDVDTTFTDAYQDEYYWGNLAAGIKWIRELSGKAFLKANFYHSRYFYRSINAYEEKFEVNRQQSNGYFEINEFRSSINESGLRLNLDFLINYRHRVKSGISLALHQYMPGIIAYGEDATQHPDFSIGSPLPDLPDSLFDALSFQSKQASLNVEDIWDFNPNWQIIWGFNLLVFSNSPDFFNSLQPRLSISRKWTENRITFSLIKLYQPQHLISADDNGLPNELWVPATNRVPPQRSWQADLSWVRHFTSTQIRGSIYYKTMSGLVTFREAPGYLIFGTLDNVDASIWEEDMLTGEGVSWGIETNLQHSWSKLLLQFNYTFGKSNRYFPGKYLDLKVPYEFESPHTFNMIGVYSLNERWKIGASWQLSSGTRYNLVPGSYDIYDNAYYFLDQIEVPENTVDLLIMPVYHRLDLSLSYFLQGNRLSHQLKLGLLNVYDRKNIVFPRLYRDVTTEVRYVQGLPFIPSLSYRLTLE
ncbi:MAG: TonB-dependent receptor [Saprospiraceae bacterium]|nr:TonB-dependent receptor [Saprospiraceae bacterium]